MEEASFTVAYADATAWVPNDEPLTVESIWLALVLALIPEAEPAGPLAWFAETGRRVRKFLATEVEITDLEASAGPLKVKAHLTSQSTLFQQAARHLRETRGMQGSVFKLLGDAAKDASAAGRPLVIMLDGIEKAATGDFSAERDRESFRNHWFEAFTARAGDLRPPAHVIYTVPSFMIRRAAEVGLAMGHELEFLPMVRVWQRDLVEGQAQVDKTGVQAMREALFSRVPTDHFAEPRVADWLILHSGGFIRDLMRLASECIFACRKPGETITREIAEAAIIRIQETYRSGLEEVDRALLRQVHERRDYPLDAELGPRMDRLLQGFMMMRYHNSHFWYGAHPILWPLLGVQAPGWPGALET